MKKFKNLEERDYKVLCELKEKLAKKIILLDIRVFGSRARGNAEEFSDLDVFIEIPTLDRKIKDIIKTIAWEVSLENSIVISPLIFSKDELTNSPLKCSPVVKNIMEEGIKI
jgi:predicted nucleotidyltransferase